MDIEFETTPGEAQAAITNTKATDPTPSTPVAEVVDDDDPRLVALRTAAAALLPAAGLADTDNVAVSMAMSDEPGWAVVRVAHIIKAD